MDKWFEDGDHVRADRLGRLPLHLAAAYGHVQVVQVCGERERERERESERARTGCFRVVEGFPCMTP
jgi:hypothetical protein